MDLVAQMDMSILKFDEAISVAHTSLDVWRALEELSVACEGHKLFTVTTVDMKNEVARRLYSNHPLDYPVTGTKPIHRDAWFDHVHDGRRSFVANTIADIAKVFPDHALIWSLGCGSVINLPVFLHDELVATVNLLHGEHHYTPARARLIESHLSLPAKLCCALAMPIAFSLHA